MHPDLIAYVCGSLDEAARTQFESLLKDDAELRRLVAVARQRLSPLMAAEPVAPPEGLAVRTYAFIAENVCKNVSPAPAPVEITTTLRGAFERPWWRRIDVVVAASIAFTFIGLGLPAIYSLRVAEMQTRCENNLRQLWEGLSAYQMQRGDFPDVASATRPRPAAGLVVPMLRDAGVLTPADALYCPAAADKTACLNAGLSELAKMPDEEYERAAGKLLPGYAYSLGYRDGAGRMHGPTAKLPDVPAAQMPLVADAPAIPVAFGNSPNHSGRGQNVLFSDGHVAFKTQRTAGLPGDDIYLNEANRVAAGLNAHDVVLAGGGSQP